MGGGSARERIYCQIATVLCVLIASISSAGADTGQKSLHKPLLIYYERDPWLMVIGSDSPSFALYDNGEVYYESGDKNPTRRFMSARLPAKSLDALLQELDLSRNLSAFDHKTIEAADATDQPDNEIRYWIAGQPHVVNIYGPMSGPGAERKKVPPSVLHVLDTIAQFKAPDAKPWVPPYIEVMIWPFEYSKVSPRAWPSDWPGISDPTTRKRRDDNYSIYLSSKHFARFLEYYGSLGEKQAILLDNRKWALSYRIPFPGE